MRNIKILFAFVSILLLLYGCASTTNTNTENTIVANTPTIQAVAQKEDLQGLWKGEFSDPFTDYIYFSNSDIYFMGSKSQPSEGSFSNKYKISSNYEITVDSEGRTTCTFNSNAVKAYTGYLSSDNGQLKMSIVGDTINGEYELISKDKNLLSTLDEGEEPEEDFSYSNPDFTESYSTSGVTSDEKGFAWAAAEQEIKARLKAPSTAKFPTYNSATISKSGNKYQIIGYVDSQNSFGAKIRASFIVEIEKVSDTSYNVISVDIYE